MRVAWLVNSEQQLCIISKHENTVRERGYDGRWTVRFAGLLIDDSPTARW